MGRSLLASFFCLLGFALNSQEEHPSELQRGEALYRHYCASCHGREGGGLAEARLAFPEDHRRCERCHKPNNPKQMTLSAMNPRNAFAIGEAPGLRDLSRFQSAYALYSYIRATMPRYAPGSLSDEAYLDITAYLLALNESTRDIRLDHLPAAY